ncbi:TonB-dependent receptor [Planctomycetales bacterium]|nr:TonB-dependent receptor [Planctomycetales bacterium]
MNKFWAMVLGGTFSAFGAEVTVDTSGEVATREATTYSRVLDPIVVTAGRIEEDRRNVTQAMTVVGQEEIAKHQYHDVADILRNYGLQVDASSQNSAMSQIVIRGMRGGQADDNTGLASPILLLIDGRRAGTDNLAMIPLVNVERIEVVRGPGAVQYGTTAMGGVVNIITKRGGEKPSLSLESGGGSFGTFKSQIEGSAAAKKVDISAGAAYLTTQSYNVSSDRPARLANLNRNHYANTGIDNKTAYSMNVGYTPSAQHRLGFTMDRVTVDHAGNPNQINNPDKSAATNYLDLDNYSFDFAYTGGADALGLTWEGRYFFGENKYYVENFWDAYGFGADTRDITRYQGAQGQVNFSQEFLTVTGGIDWNNYDSSHTDNAKYSASTFAHHNSDQHNLGLFALAKLAFFDDRLILSGGGRGDFYWAETHGTGIKGQRKNLSHLAPAAGIAVRPFAGVTLRSNYSQAFRLPQAIESFGYRLGGLNYKGDPNLKPESGETWDVGADFNYRSFDFGVTWFNTFYENKIDAIQTPTFDYQYVNRKGTTNYQGLEFTGGFDIGDALGLPLVIHPYVNATAMLNYRDGDGLRLSRVSDLAIGYGVNFAYEKIGTSFDIRATYYGKREDTDVSVAPPYDNPTVTVGGVTTLDLFVQQRLYKSEKYGQLSIKGELRNITDAWVETVANYPMPGRSFYLGLRYDF